MPRGPVETPITDQEIAFAHLILAGKLTDRDAAEAVGISPGQAGYVKAKPRVKEYMEQHRASVRAGLVQHEVKALAEFNIGREQILARSWEFASIDPKLTGYNTTSQSKALEFLWKALGFESTKKPGDDEPEPPPPDVYRAAWLRKPGDQEPEEENSKPIQSPVAPPSPARGAVVPLTSTALSNANSLDRPAESAAPHSRVSGGQFGRFQGL